MKRRVINTYDPRKPSLGRRVGSFFCMFVMFYLGFHAITGEHGALALFRESHKLEMLQAELTEATTKNQTLERKVKLMSSNSLDLDMLDQQVRRVLGVAGRNEAVYFFNNDKN